MQALALTDTVRALLSEQGAAALLVHLQAIRRAITINEDGLTEWDLDAASGTVTARTLLDTGDAEFGPVVIRTGFRLPQGSIVSAMAEEHAQLIIDDGKVWTLGDLVIDDAPRFFHGLEFRISTDACRRLSGMLLTKNPSAFWNRRSWPNAPQQGGA